MYRHSRGLSFEYDFADYPYYLWRSVWHSPNGMWFLISRRDKMFRKVSRERAMMFRISRDEARRFIEEFGK